jgi:hypothetical protein
MLVEAATIKAASTTTRPRTRWVVDGVGLRSSESAQSSMPPTLAAQVK